MGVRGWRVAVVPIATLVWAAAPEAPRRAAAPADLGSELVRRLADGDVGGAVELARAAGPAGATVLRDLAVSGPPDVVPVAMHAWNAARWEIGPGRAADVVPLLGSFGAASVRAAWDGFLASRGPGTLAVVARLMDTAGFQEGAFRVVPLVLSAMPPIEFASWLAACEDPAVLAAVRRLLRESAERVPDAGALARMCETMLLLWWYADVPSVAVRGWAFSRDDAFVRFAAAAVRRGGLEPVIAEALRRLREGRADRAARGDEILFWVRVAAAAGAGDRIRGALRPLDVARLPARDAAELILECRRLGLADEALRLLEGTNVPWLLYLRSSLCREAGDVAGADAHLEAAFARIGRGEDLDQAAAFETGEVMDRAGDVEAAVRVWSLIIDRPPHGQIQDVNALLRLARVAETRGDFAAALAHSERALEISRDLGAEQTLIGPAGQRGTEWLMRAILELRRRAGGAARN